MLLVCKQCPMNNKCICDYASDECNVRIQAYNQAIDDFVEKINYTAYTPVCVDCMTKNQIIELAEQLKAGERE